MHTVGLTGGIGSGKSTVAKLFGELGTHWVDMDDIARVVVAPGEPALRTISQHFKHPQILTASGELNRPLLRDIIFAQPQQKAWLESLLHPLIRQRTYQVLKHPSIGTTNNCYNLLVSPLLFEKNIAVEASIAIDVMPNIQIQRACQRDKTSPENIQRIMDSQLSAALRNNKADFIIENNHSLAATLKQVKALHSQLLNHFNHC